jgi:mersacidin/lichenicidin family type 2 lantibiotic
MNKNVDIVRAWKDPLYRAGLTPEEQAQVPAHPAGLLELSDEQIQGVAAGALTTAMRCTELSCINFRACCPK